MKRLITSAFLVLSGLPAFAQSSGTWTWGYVDNAPIDINPEYPKHVVAVHGNVALWGDIVNKKATGNVQFGDYMFRDYDTSGNVLHSTNVTGKLSVISAKADGSGNWYVLAQYEDTIQFSTGSFIKPIGGSDYCIFRLSGSDLQLDWVKPAGGDFFCTVACFTVANNSIYMPVDTSDGTVICKLDVQDGSRTDLWYQDRHSWTTDIEVDSKGNVYMAGTCAFNGIDFNGHLVTLPASFQYPQYIVRYKANGAYDWSLFMQDGTCFVREITVADDNTIYMTGPLNDSLTLGNLHLHAPSGFGSYLISQMDSSGHFNWVKQQTDTGIGVAYLTTNTHAVAGPDKSIVVLASTSRYNDWGNGVTTYTDNSRKAGTVVSYDKAGMALWAKQATGAGVVAQQIAGDGNNIWVTGNIVSGEDLHLDAMNVPVPIGGFAYYPFVARLRNINIINGIEDVGTVKALTLGPNPAENYFTIWSEKTTPLQVVIKDQLGKCMMNRIVKTNERIPISGLAHGLYFVEAITSTARTFEKLIIQ